MNRTTLVCSLLSIGLSLAGPAWASSFNFDNGTSQGWTTSLYAGGTQVNTGAAGWSDTNNYPASPGADPTGDDQGSAFQYSVNPSRDSGSFAHIMFKSPDLSGDAGWQNLKSFSGELLPSFVSENTYYANALLVINDTSGGGSTQRIFVNHDATPVSNDNWNLESFTNIDSLLASAGVTSYTTKAVAFNFWWSNSLDSEMTFAVDQVGSTEAAPPPAGVPEPSSWLLMGLGLAALGLRTRRGRPA